MEALFVRKQFQLYFRAILLGVLMLPLLAVSASWADGSKDLIKNGGNRPFLEAGYNRSTAGIDRLNRFYVFARANEKIQLGSSAFGLYEGDILYKRPDGTSGACSLIKPATASQHWGVIQNLDEEKVGPQPEVGGYTPCEVEVDAANEGVWEIVFIGPAPNSWKFSDPITTTVDWVQAADVFTIAAWDVSVYSENEGLIAGRVYAQHLPLNMGAAEATFAGQLFTITKDGYQYQVDYNDARGHSLLLMANDAGFQDAQNDEPLYGSVLLDPLNAGNNGLPTGVKLANPYVDNSSVTTHKLFFNTPAADLPVAAMMGNEPAWLRSNVSEPAAVSNLTYTGSVGKTGSFSFESTDESRFILTIDLNENGIWGDEKDTFLTGTANAGNNIVPWNGMDGEGYVVTGSGNGYKARVVAIAGEVHFPAIDVENQPLGFTLARTNGAGSPAYTIYYDDRVLLGKAGSLQELNGIGGTDSRAGAHLFKEGFGDDAGIDTWAYVESAPAYIDKPIFELHNDLRLAIDLDVEAPASNQQFLASVRVANDGPDDASFIRVKLGLPGEFSLTTAEGTAGVYIPDDGVWQIEGIPNGTEAILDLVLSATDGGAFPITAEVIEHRGFDPDSEPDNVDERLPNQITEDDADEVYVFVDAAPALGLAQHVKSLTGDFSSFTAELEVLVENLGNTPLTDLQLTERLGDRFAGTSFQILEIEATESLKVNPSFDGVNDTNLLASEQSALDRGEQGAVVYKVEVNPLTNMGPYAGNVVGFAEGLGAMVDDTSDEGLETDANQDGKGDSSGEDDPTVLAFPQRPAIGLAMQAKNLTGTDASFGVDYQLVVENLGNVPLTGVQIINDLGGVFGANTTISNLWVGAPLVANPGFDGQGIDEMLNASASNLGLKEKATITFRMDAAPSIRLGFFNQLAQVTANAPDNTFITDLSDNGIEPDANSNGIGSDPGEEDPTVISFGEKPEMGAILTTVSTEGSLDAFEVTYELTIKNLGSSVLTSVQALEDLENVFSGTSFSVSGLSASLPLQVNPEFDGQSDKQLLANTGITLAPQASGIISFKVAVDPETNFGPYRNTVVVSGDGPDGTTATDLSDSSPDIDPNNNGTADEVNENDPTVTAIASTGHLGLALGVSSVSGDLNGFDVAYVLVAENLGDVPLSEVEIRQDLAASLPGTHFEVLQVSAPEGFEVNPLFDGDQDQNLLISNTGEIEAGGQLNVEVLIRVLPIDNFGPYTFSGDVNAVTPFRFELSDKSTSGLNPDPDNDGNPTEETENTATMLAITERPVVGLSMGVSSISGDLKGFTARYVLRLENLGDVPLNDVTVDSDFLSTFQGTEFEILRHIARGPIEVNPAFDGLEVAGLLDESQSTLAPGDTARIELDVRVVPAANLGPYEHSFVASAMGPNGASTSDISTDGYIADPNKNGIPNEANDNRPTIVSPMSTPAIGAAKKLTDIQQTADGFEAAFDVVVRNTGDVVLSEIKVVEDLETAFPGASIEVLDIDVSGPEGFIPNAAFDGVSDLGVLEKGSPGILLPGRDVVVSYRIGVVPVEGESTFITQAIVGGTDPSGSVVLDLSHNGINPDPNGDGIPSEESENEPTLVVSTLKPALEFDTLIDYIEGDSTLFDVQLSLLLENAGATVLDSLNITLNLSDIFEGASVSVRDVQVLTGEDWEINDIVSTGMNELFAGDGITLQPGSSGRIKLLVQVNPGISQGPFKGQLIANAMSGRGNVVYEYAQVAPIKLSTSTGREAGLESNGDLSSLISVRNYRQQHLGWLQSAAKGASSPVFRNAGVDAVDGDGGFQNLQNLDLIPTDGPDGSTGLVTTPLDLFGITNATSVLAIDYMKDEARLAALFATTTQVDEIYDHSKNICDRLKGASLEKVELVSIKGHPFVLSVLEHDNGEVDYAISFIGYLSGANYLVDSRFIREAYQTRPGINGEILNFQVWSYNPAHTIKVVEDILDRMDAIGGLAYVSQESDVPQIPEFFVQQGSYQSGQLVFRMRQPDGVSELRFQGEISSTEGGEKSVFQQVVTVDQSQEETVVVLPSGVLFDALLTVTNDVNDNVDQVYLADGPWGLITDEQEGTEVDAFDILEQGRYDLTDSHLVIERGVSSIGKVKDNVVLFRHFRPGGRSINLSDFSYISFKASGKGVARLRLEESGESEDFFTKDIPLEETAKTHTIFFEEFSKRDGQAGFRGLATSALSFLIENTGSASADFEIRVEEIMFGKGQPTQIEDDGLIPTVYSLSQNYPNPFNPSTTIQFGLPEPAEVSLTLYDMVGRKVMTIAQQDYIAGRHKVVLDASRLASGAYLDYLSRGEFNQGNARCKMKSSNLKF